MPFATYVPFILASLAVLLTPGPTNTILAASSAAMGLRNARLLPLAEAAGYAIAISAFLTAASYLAQVEAALPVLKCIAAVWLLFSAWKLWSQPVMQEVPDLSSAMKRVFVTTLLNPKAMLVGTIIIPTFLPAQPISAVACFICLSMTAGLAWITVGSMIPGRLRPYAYKTAAVIIGFFSFAAVSSAANLV
ncbi:threonine transporter [Aureimonas sp. Leaf454]|uniref:LysE family translocator n=1 Tax=Aureimonas sp. Leaf454 TaxID=1736381 RepID=UPI000700105D|nr:LysE family transporter [Aureimonas sp. Leaf454]KQT50273.1 threonine transporter [Aureimonas sp. Leaf454]